MAKFFKLIEGINWVCLTEEGKDEIDRILLLPEPERAIAAIEMSVKKWQYMVELYRAGGPFDVYFNGARGTCALCYAYYKDYDTNTLFCATCPIYEKTDLPFCQGTPYEDSAGLRGALAEVDFLRELLEEAKSEY